MTTTKKTTKAGSRKKTATRKTEPKKTAATSSPEHKASQAALKLIDDAASLLRKAVTTGADAGEKARENAQKKAHGMVSKAHNLLGNALDQGVSGLHGLIGKPRKGGSN